MFIKCLLNAIATAKVIGNRELSKECFPHLPIFYQQVNSAINSETEMMRSPDPKLAPEKIKPFSMSPHAALESACSKQ